MPVQNKAGHLSVLTRLACIGADSHNVRLQRVHRKGVDLGRFLLPGQQQALQRYQLLGLQLLAARMPARRQLSHPISHGL